MPRSAVHVETVQSAVAVHVEAVVVAQVEALPRGCGRRRRRRRSRWRAFKQVYLALVVAMIGLKWLFVPFALAQRIADISEFWALSELRIILPTAALLVGAAQVARRGSLHGGVGLTLMFAVFSLGCALTIFDGFGGAALAAASGDGDTSASRARRAVVDQRALRSPAR